MQIALSVENLSKTYGQLIALEQVSLSIPAGTSLGLAGLNGAGKTSLLRCILNFTHSDRGDINIFGIPATNDEARQSIAYVPERFSGPAYLTGLEYLRFQMHLEGKTLDEHQSNELAKRLDLDRSALKRMLRSYSKGMTQKLGLLAALISKRNLLILDEPMSGLDPQARTCVRNELQAHRANGGSLFFTSHALDDIDLLCDNMAILHQGKIIYSGGCEQLRQRTQQTDLTSAFLRSIGQ